MLIAWKASLFGWRTDWEYKPPGLWQELMWAFPRHFGMHVMSFHRDWFLFSEKFEQSNEPIQRHICFETRVPEDEISKTFKSFLYIYIHVCRYIYIYIMGGWSCVDNGMTFIKQTVVKVFLWPQKTAWWWHDPSEEQLGKKSQRLGDLKLRLVETRKDAAEVKKLKMENYKLLSAA